MSQCDRCADPGVCCKSMVLNTKDGAVTHWDKEHAARDMEERKLPFKVISINSEHFDDVTNKPYFTYRLGCPKLGEDGRCTDYENRPQVCRDFEPGSDRLCAHYVEQNNA